MSGRVTSLCRVFTLRTQTTFPQSLFTFEFVQRPRIRSLNIFNFIIKNYLPCSYRPTRQQAQINDLTASFDDSEHVEYSLHNFCVFMIFTFRCWQALVH